MNFLDEDQSRKLLCRNVFLENGCPPELEQIGKKIVRECKGLPLSIVVIGGLVRNSRSRRDYWEKFTIDLNSILMSGNDEHCFAILSLSYNHLPAHLKPCFLTWEVFKKMMAIWVFFEFDSLEDDEDISSVSLLWNVHTLIFGESFE